MTVFLVNVDPVRRTNSLLAVAADEVLVNGRPVCPAALSGYRRSMKPEIEDEAVMNRIREVAGAMLSEDIPPIVISYALTYVSAELGLRAEPDAKRVLSTLLGSMALAVQAAVLEESDLESSTAMPQSTMKQ